MNRRTYHHLLLLGLLAPASQMLSGCDPPASGPWPGGGTWGDVVDDSGDSGEPEPQTVPERAAEDPAGETTQLRILLEADSSSDVDELWLRIDEVRLHHATEGWLVASDAEVVTDLLRLQDGGAEELALDDVPEGDYDELRVHVAEAWVLVGGQRFPLEMTGADSSGIPVSYDFELPACGVVQMTLAWDVGTNLSLDSGYVLEPVIELEAFEFASECGAAGGGGTGGPIP